ncbi:hypothetical protein T08_1852 [Trichinella sp. T8]|nr:hypothetical protein T08_1852 [Trichinella sp. T8]
MVIRIISTIYSSPILESSTASKRVHLPCAYLNTRGSSPSETPLISIDDIFRHYNEVFAEKAETCVIFRCFGQVDFPSFSDHFE